MSQGEPAQSPQTACGVGLFVQSQHCTGGAAPLLRYGEWEKKNLRPQTGMTGTPNSIIL